MTTITRAQHYAQIKQHEELLERMRTKYVDECNRIEVAKEVKRSNKIRRASAGKGDHVDVSV